MGSSERSLSQDLVYDILSSPRRRYVLYYLRQMDEPIELTALAEQVAAWENETTPDSLTDQERKRVYVSLYQTHIPKLDDADIVSYDKDEGTVELANKATTIDEYLQRSSSETPWQRIYLAIAAVGGALLLVTVLDVSVFSALSEPLAAVVVIVGFLVTSALHYVEYRQQEREPPVELQRKR
jgi:energy-converting hydrogenase Eha subunit C